MCAGSYATDVFAPLSLGRVQLSPLSIYQQHKVFLCANHAEKLSLVVSGQGENDFVGLNTYHINLRTE